MHMGTCRYCNHSPVARKAPFCPHCGHPHPLGSQGWPILVVLAVGILMLFVVISILRHQPGPRRRGGLPQPWEHARVLHAGWQGTHGGSQHAPVAGG
jgi:hypothetical protein